ncbi:hypothetical protein D3C72_2470310 [compost metagenome]
MLGIFTLNRSRCFLFRLKVRQLILYSHGPVVRVADSILLLCLCSLLVLVVVQQEWLPEFVQPVQLHFVH